MPPRKKAKKNHPPKPLKLDEAIVKELKDWFIAYKDFAHDEANRALHRNQITTDWFDTARGIRATRLPVSVERGSICQHYFRSSAGHWYSFFPGADGVVVYDPSYPLGPYYNKSNFQKLMRAARVTFGPGVKITYYKPSVAPLQLHEEDNFCQTWSMMQLAGGEWQTRIQSVEANKDNDERLQLLYDFIEDWIELAHPEDYDTLPLYTRLQKLKRWFNHYYKLVDYVDARRLWP